MTSPSRLPSPLRPSHRTTPAPFACRTSRCPAPRPRTEQDKNVPPKQEWGVGYVVHLHLAVVNPLTRSSSPLETHPHYSSALVAARTCLLADCGDIATEFSTSTVHMACSGSKTKMPMREKKSFDSERHVEYDAGCYGHQLTSLSYSASAFRAFFAPAVLLAIADRSLSGSSSASSSSSPPFLPLQ